MNLILLTKTGGILAPFAWILGIIMNLIYEGLSFIGIQNVSIAIIVFTLIVNLLLIPMTLKQQKTMRLQSVMNPEIQKIQKKYRNKKDEVSMRKQQEETSAVYRKYGSSPTGGCGWMVVQMLVLMGLYQVIYHIPAYVTSINELYANIATPIMSAPGASDIMVAINSATKMRVANFDITNVNKVIDVLGNLKSSGWDELATAFSGSPEVVNAIAASKDTILHVNSFLGGLNIMDTPVQVQFGAGFFSNFFSTMWPGILIPILAGLSQWASITVMQGHQSKAMEENQMMSSMKTANMMMPLLSVWMCCSFATGIGIYWIASAVFRTIITWCVNKYYASEDIDEIIAKNKEKMEKKGYKPSLMDKLMGTTGEGATTSSSDSDDSYSVKSVSKTSLSNNKKLNENAARFENTQIDKENVDMSSISSIAHMINNSNNGKKDK